MFKCKVVENSFEENVTQIEATIIAFIRTICSNNRLRVSVGPVFGTGVAVGLPSERWQWFGTDVE